MIKITIYKDNDRIVVDNLNEFEQGVAEGMTGEKAKAKTFHLTTAVQYDGTTWCMVNMARVEEAIKLILEVIITAHEEGEDVELVHINEGEETKVGEW